MSKFDEMMNRKGTYCTQWDYCADRFGREAILPFSISDSDFKMPEQMITTLKKRVDHGIFGYSRWNHEDFKNSISSWYQQRFAYQVKKEAIVYGPTVMYMIKTLLQLQKQKNQTVLVHQPMYDGFIKMFIGLGLHIVTIPIETTDPELLTEIYQQYPHSFYLLCNPHNPTGKLFSEAELTHIVRCCKKNNIFIISDEIHMDITFKKKHQPILKVAEKLTYLNNVVLITSATKTFNFASLLCAYMFIYHDELRARYLYTLRNIDCLSSPSILGVLATQTGYNSCSFWVDEQATYIYQNHLFIQDYIKRNQLPIEYRVPDATYFAWFKIKKLSISEQQLQEKLVAAGIGIMPGSYYQAEGVFLRLNVAAPKQKIQRGMNILKRVLIEMNKDEK